MGISEKQNQKDLILSIDLTHLQTTMKHQLIIGQFAIKSHLSELVSKFILSSVLPKVAFLAEAEVGKTLAAGVAEAEAKAEGLVLGA